MVTIKVKMTNDNFNADRNIKNDFAYKFIELNKDNFINLDKERNITGVFGEEAIGYNFDDKFPDIIIPTNYHVDRVYNENGILIVPADDKNIYIQLEILFDDDKSIKEKVDRLKRIVYQNIYYEVQSKQQEENSQHKAKKTLAPTSREVQEIIDLADFYFFEEAKKYFNMIKPVLDEETCRYIKGYIDETQMYLYFKKDESGNNYNYLAERNIKLIELDSKEGLEWAQELYKKYNDRIFAYCLGVAHFYNKNYKEAKEYLKIYEKEGFVYLDKCLLYLYIIYSMEYQGKKTVNVYDYIAVGNGCFPILGYYANVDDKKEKIKEYKKKYKDLAKMNRATRRIKTQYKKAKKSVSIN